MDSPMGIIRMIFYALALYFFYNFFKGLFSKSEAGKEVKGKNNSEPIDFHKEIVEDAKYKDIEEE
jgi:hypothetical protein